MRNSVHVSDKKEDLNPSPVTNKSKTVFLHVNSFVANVHFVIGLPQKKGVNPNCCYNHTEIKHVNDVSCVGHLSSANAVTNVPPVVIHPPVWARLQQYWEKWEALGSSPKVVTILREGYTLPFRFRPNLTRSPTVIINYQNRQRQADLLEALYQLTNNNSLGFYNQLFLVHKPKNWWRPILDLSTLNTFLNTELFKMETPETIRTFLQIGEWVTSIDIEDAYFHILLHSESRKYMRFYIQGQFYQFKALPVGLSTAPGVHGCGQRGQTDGFAEGYKNPPVPRQLFGESHIPPNLSPAYTVTGSSLSRTRVAGEQGQVRTGTKTGLQPTSEHWQTSTDKIWSIRSGVSSPTVHVPHRTSDSHRKSCPPRSTSYETHSVALVKQLEGTRITRKFDSCSQVTPPSLKVGAGGKQCSSRLTITPTTPTQIFTDASKEGWGAHLNECTARGTWSVPESKLHINHLDLKAVFLAFKRVPRPLFKQHSPGSHRQHNSRCLYQQRRGRKSGFLCALLWRILSWCKGKQVTLKTRHIPGRLNMIADKQSRLGQTIQTEWSLYPDVFMTICSWWHQPQVDLFATRFNNKTTTVCVTGSGLPGMGSECT